jgi:hypothetical protein
MFPRGIHVYGEELKHLGVEKEKNNGRKTDFTYAMKIFKELSERSRIEIIFLLQKWLQKWLRQL